MPVGAGEGGKPPVELSNNLSLPAATETDPSVTWRWAPPLNPNDPTLDASLLGVHYSYGCDKPEEYDTGVNSFSYPNTSCVDDLMEPMVYLDADTCTEAADAKCYGYPVYRIFWQKVPVNDWWAESDKFDILGGENSRTAAYVDWGDALEAVSWNVRSVIRVETQPYGSLMVDPSTGLFDDMLDEGIPPAPEPCDVVAERLGLADPCRTGFKMWHVSGQGQTEQWGVVTTDPADGSLPVPYVYESPFQIIKASNALINFTKLEAHAAECPGSGSGGPGDPAPVISSDAWNGAGWDGTCQVFDDPYTVELSVTGKYVYGYNLRMKNVDMGQLSEPCNTWETPGWWRLTFYTTNDAVFFDPANPVLATTAPPAMTSAPVVVLESEDEDSETLYSPDVDYDNNLTYIDICILDKVRGRDRE
jgi:hypothetical protein